MLISALTGVLIEAGDAIEPAPPVRAGGFFLGTATEENQAVGYRCSPRRLAFIAGLTATEGAKRRLQQPELMAPFRVMHAGQICGGAQWLPSEYFKPPSWGFHFFDRPGVHADNEVMDQKAPLITISVSNPTSFSGKGSIIFLEYIDKDAALKVARKIARETGRLVTVQADNRLIDMIPPVTTH